MQDELAKKNITWIEAKRTARIESGGDPWLTPYAPQERRWPNES